MSEPTTLIALVENIYPTDIKRKVKGRGIVYMNIARINIESGSYVTYGGSIRYCAKGIRKPRTTTTFDTSVIPDGAFYNLSKKIYTLSSEQQERFYRFADKKKL
ncbi:hypothetical protein CMI42_05260 [Candidatus Pacearchaeota archaeon]|nr:hypothetical protein [Candidatus Pacearchaeota archaeon]|tara:strand:- start:55 stop:366 length:312 start_codon:yes stop_codon:yes gene_type:complete